MLEYDQRGRGGPLSVEYGEMDAAMTTEINQSTGTASLLLEHFMFPSLAYRSLLPLIGLRMTTAYSFGFLQVCMHMPALDFLNQVANSLEKDNGYHLSIHGCTMGLKLEQFIFETFSYSQYTTLFEYQIRIDSNKLKEKTIMRSSKTSRHGGTQRSVDHSAVYFHQPQAKCRVCFILRT